MRVGSIVYATEQGLGYLAKSFYDYGVLDDVVVVEHTRRPTKNWYPKAQHVPIREVAVSEVIRKFCTSMDVMFFFETPFYWPLIDYCKQHNVRTALMPMFECMPKSHPMPDIVVNPSLLDQKYYTQGVFLPAPVAAQWMKRTRARVFVHNAGHGGLKGRNGTSELLEALQYVESPLKLILRSQEPIDKNFRIGRNMTIDVQGPVPYESLWKEGDVFVFPEKFNGLSLPLQEAFASGLACMCGDRFPMNTWLPTEPLIRVDSYRKNSVSPRCLEFEEAIFDPRDIARAMDAWYGRDITSLSLCGREWGEQTSWNKLRSKYRELLCGSST